MEPFVRIKTNTAAHIRSRGEDAWFKREVNSIAKNQRQIDRKYRIGERKNTATQRGIVSLLGNNVYLDPGILDGKEGAFEDQAANVVSDIPVLDEILSCPQILPILCDLRTTALLGRNPQLLSQFIEGLQKSSPDRHLNLFPDTQDPLTSLRAFRAQLIKNLFEEIRIQAEFRLNSAAREAGHSANPQLNSTSRLFSEQRNDSWNQALFDKLEEIAAEEEVSANDADATESFMVVHPVSSVLDLANADNCASTNADFTPVPHNRPCRALKRVPTASTVLKTQHRAKFDSTVREIIDEIQNVVTLGKRIRELRRKNPKRAECSTGLLEKFLQGDMFTSLNSQYCSLLKEQGQLTASEFQQCLGTVTSTVELKNTVEQKSLITKDLSNDSTKLAEKSPSFNFDEVLHNFNRSAGIRNQEKVKGQLKTTNRLCCPACKAKLRHGYQIFRERDNKFEKQIQQSGKTPKGNLRREIEKSSTFHRSATPSFDLYHLDQSPFSSKLNLNSLHIQDSALLQLDEPSFTDFLPLSLGLSTLNSQTVMPISPISPPVQNLKVFPALATPLSYAPSPLPRLTVPVPSPGPPTTSVFHSRDKKRRHNQLPATSFPTKTPQLSWTLKVSRYDLFKLRQELERHAIEERMLKFTKHLALQNAESRKNLPITNLTFHEE